MDAVAVAEAFVRAINCRNAENLVRLTAALEEMHAAPRTQHCWPFASLPDVPTAPGHHHLTTSFGYLDVLGVLGDSLTCEHLFPHTEMMDLGEGLSIRVLDLPTLIRLKEQAGRPKDLSNVLHLKEVLREKSRRRSS